MRTLNTTYGTGFNPFRHVHEHGWQMSMDRHGPHREDAFGPERRGRHERRGPEAEEFGHHGRRGHEQHEEGHHGPERRGRGHRDEPPFGLERPGRHGRRGDRGGPRIGRGDVRSAILLLLAEQPSHGYQIIQQVNERSGGIWQPSPGSVYPALQMLEDEGLVVANEQDGRRVFQLTDTGRSYVEGHQDELNTVWKSVTDTVDDSEIALQDLFQQVGKALRTVVNEGTATQISSARELLSSTRRQLYLILAGEDATSDNDRP
ncbi:hypothetical protein KDA_62440 [Dictyobacter alpinus]|uniref:Transcription regulator PadR N-terminal domain-containing protein n=1 Tax=Dictyobacter alpinus TaxID=2014873 RepID=A0A402BHI9_9CHLR|nr:PadR family transcriptional regulator [Dictyobacter alpinus]GCE30760.1 hypothetical protein KDA_62440 [Dictyobacter alpinus]